jgi:hypothetical protein
MIREIAEIIYHQYIKDLKSGKIQNDINLKFFENRNGD